MPYNRPQVASPGQRTHSSTMSLHVNFAANGKELGDAYQAVLSASDPTDWLLYSYEKGSNDLRVQATGGTLSSVISSLRLNCALSRWRP